MTASSFWKKTFYSLLEKQLPILSLPKFPGPSCCIKGREEKKGGARPHFKVMVYRKFSATQDRDPIGIGTLTRGFTEAGGEGRGGGTEHTFLMPRPQVIVPCPGVRPPRSSLPKSVRETHPTGRPTEFPPETRPDLALLVPQEASE